MLGIGKRLFEPSAAPTALRLVESKPMGKGTVLAIYQPAGKPTHDEFQMEEGFGLRQLIHVRARDQPWRIVRRAGNRRHRPLDLRGLSS